MEREEKNHQAYDDVLDRKPPSVPEDDEYMMFYRSWRGLLPQEDF